MKRTVRFLAMALCAVVMVTQFSLANDSDATRSEFEKAFVAQTQSSITAMNEVASQRGIATKGITPKLTIASVSVPNATATATAGNTTATATATTTCNLGVKFWFEDLNGNCVNPIRKRWDPKQQLYINVQATVPVYVAIYQNYPDSRPTSRQVYPDAAYPESLKALQPGQSTRLPVLFQLDNDMRDEIISIVVVRADWKGIQPVTTTTSSGATVNTGGLTANATASITTNNNTDSTTTTTANASASVQAQLTSVGGGTMKCINDAFFAKGTKISIASAQSNLTNSDGQTVARVTADVNSAVATASASVTVNNSSVATSTQPNDVCSYMFGAGYVGQWQFTVKK